MSSIQTGTIEQTKHIEKIGTAINYLGENPNLLSKNVQEKLEKIITIQKATRVTDDWEVKHVFREICSMTFFEYQKIFENVISDGEYTPYALLKKDNKIIGVLKFREFAYCLHFEDMIDTHNKLIAYKGLISHPRLEKYFKTELLQSLNKDSVGIINLHSGLTIFPVIMIYANYDKHYQEYIRSSDYFTSKNIHEKIERFQSKTEEKMKQKETRIFEYNDGLYNHS